MSCTSVTKFTSREITPELMKVAASRRVFWFRYFARLVLVYRRRRQRKHLLRLDDRLLADIGVSRREAEREARKPLWR
jgi:uncharacterized protein YjiS (DUF1127 family)